MKLNLAKAFAVSALPLMTACAPGTVSLSTHGEFRHMTPNEITFARTIFGNELDYGSVKIFKQSAKKGRARGGVMNGVYMPQNIYTSDYALLGDFKMKSIFIHELTHVWQHQHGTDITGSAIGLFFEKGGNYNRSYDYELPDLFNFGSLNIEQQASIIEDYFQARHKIETDKDLSSCDNMKFATELLHPYFPDLRAPRLCR